MSVFQNTPAWEQQEWNNTKKQKNNERSEAGVRKVGMKKNPTAYHYQIKMQ